MFYDAAFVFSDSDTVTALHSRGLRHIPATEALVQGFHGRGPVPIENVVYFLARHGLARLDQVREVRAFVAILGKAGLLVWSNKKQTLRVATPLVDPGSDYGPALRVVEPDRPFSNVLQLREVLRECEGHVWWAEPQLERKVLETLVQEADSMRISEIRLLSGPAGIDKAPEATRMDWKRFRKEMLALGISAEWRVVAKNDLSWHDRFILTRDKAWNVPPLNTLLKGDYSEISVTARTPPFGDWWKAGTPLHELAVVAAGN